MPQVIINAQQKGGVGKTTDTVMEAIVASTIFDKKVLVIDTDLQGNATDFLGRTFNLEKIDYTLMRCLEIGDLSKGIVELSDNLDLIGCKYDMRKYGDFLIEKFDNIYDRTFYMSNLLDAIKDRYDYIFIDVPPSTDLKVDNAMVCADYVVVVQETQRFSFDGSKRLVFSYLQSLVDDFGSKVKVQVAGVLPVLLQNRRELHKKIVNDTVSFFGQDNVFNTIISNHARLEWYTAQGIQFNDFHDKKMFALFADIFCELEERIQAFETQGDISDYIYKRRYLTKDNKLTKFGKGLDVNGLN